MSENPESWTVESREDGTAVIFGGDGDSVAIVHGNLALDVTAMERAVEIIRLKTLSAELVEVLEEMTDQYAYLVYQTWEGQPPEYICTELMAKANAALEKAKGECNEP